MAKKFKLSSKRKTWVKNRTTTLRGKPLNYPIGVEQTYVRSINKLTNEIIEKTEKEINAIFTTAAAKEYFTADASISSLARIALNQLFSTLEKMASTRAQAASEIMVEGTNKSSQRSVNASLKELSGGLTLKTSSLGGDLPDRLKASIATNVDLITGMTSDYLDKIKDAVNRSIMFGNGLEDLIPFMEKQKGMTKRRAKNVALDQTRKAYNSLNAARMDTAGISKFEWLHSGGSQSPRKFHKDRWPAGLNGGIFDLNDPPVIDEKTGEKGLPAQLSFCKCRMVPVLTFDEGEEET